MARIWSEENKFAAWLRDEVAAVQSWSEMGAVPPAEAAKISRKGWDAVIETNLTGPFLMARAVFDAALRAGGGAIVNVLANVRNGFPTMAHTGAARAGVDNLTKSLALDWARHGIRVNCIIPGVIETAMPLADTTPAELRERGTRYPMGRNGEVDDIAGVVAFLLGADAGYMTGQAVAVNGGEILVP